eukprot:12532679-Alexandrium_andersonii.AAC.1
MSASLVGSEMCIRDRRKRERENSEPCKRQRDVASLAAAREAAYRDHAVSYTHLTLPTICSV